jgi:hypothetical protein
MRVATVVHHAASGWSAELPDWDSETTLVLAFGAPSYVDEPVVWKELLDRYPNSVIAGCSTAGEIAGSSVVDESVVVSVTQFERSTLKYASVGIDAPGESREVGRQLGRALGGSDLSAVLVLSEGLGVNGTDLARGLNETLDPGVVVTGGLAGDG